jgi:hypothetical protein
MMNMNLQPHNTRHRELIGFFGSFTDFYCNGGFLKILGAILALVGVGLVKPGSGCSSGDNSKSKGDSKYGGNCGGNSKSKGRTGRGLRTIQNDLSFIQNKANYENMSDEELKDLVDRVLHSLDINMPDNHQLHGRNLFLQLVGIVDCKPQPPQNADPIAVDDKATTLQNTTVTIPVLANDTDPNNDPLTIKSTTAPAKGGTAKINPDGTITYTPPSATFCGQDDTFEYTISDGKGGKDTAMVTVTVQCRTFLVNANDDAKTTLVNIPVNIMVLDNDKTDPAGGPLTVASPIVTLPTNGLVIILEDKKTVKYTPNKDYCGVDTFVYTAASDGGKDNALVTVTIKCVMANPDTANTKPGTNVTIDVLKNDVSVPANQKLTVTGFPTSPQYGKVEKNPDGTVTYTPTPNLPKCQPKDTFVYEVKGEDGATDTATVTVNIECEQVPPPTCQIVSPLKLFYQDDANFSGKLENGTKVCSNRRINVLVNAPQCTRVEFELKCKGVDGKEQVIEKIETRSPFYLFGNDEDGKPFWRDLDTYCGPGDYTLISKPKDRDVYGPTVSISFKAQKCQVPPRI